MSAIPRLLADRYRLLSVVARGGMGQVWEGRDELLGRTVAIKEVHFPSDVPEEERAVLGERTMREARLTARLTHRGIVTIYDVICVDDDPFIVMELVRAPSLARRIDERGPLPPTEVAEIGLQLQEALAVAHRQGIMHRDVKPSNVLLADDRVVLTDFGIATSESDATLTSTGLLIGSPTYMSPERLRGEEIGPPADLWSLGATLYAALEAEPPFRAATTMGTITAVMVDDPRPPEITGPLREVILGLLDKNVATRLTGDEVASLLRRSLEQPASVAPDLADAAPSAPSPPVMAPIVTWDSPGRTPSTGSETPEPDGLSVLQPASSFSYVTPSADDQGGSDDDGYGRLGATPADDEDATPPRRRPGLASALAAVVAVALVALIAWTQLGSPQETADPKGNGSALAGGTDSTPKNSGESTKGLKKDRGDGKPGSSGNGQGQATTTKTTSSATTSATTSATSPSVSTPTPSTASTPTSTAPQTSATPNSGTAAPAGFNTVEDPLGFQVAVPEGWQRRVASETSVDYVSPTNAANYLRIDQVATAGPSAIGAWQEYEPTLREQLSGYQRIRLEEVPFRGWEAADLEFTWESDNGTVHVLDRGFITDPRGFAILMSGPDDTWEAESRPVFDMAAATFSPTTNP